MPLTVWDLGNPRTGKTIPLLLLLLLRQIRYSKLLVLVLLLLLSENMLLQRWDHSRRNHGSSNHKIRLRNKILLMLVIAKWSALNGWQKLRIPSIGCQARSHQGRRVGDGLQRVTEDRLMLLQRRRRGRRLHWVWR